MESTARRVTPAEAPGAWVQEARWMLDRLAGQDDEIQQAAEWSSDAIAGGGLVHLFGSGHSRMGVEEMFPRYGSFPGFHPVVELSLTFHTQVVGANGQRQAMFLERVPGLAETILSSFHYRPDDVLVVFSVSGVAAVACEMATGARRRGLRTVAVTSRAHSLASTPPPDGRRLLDLVDLVIDIGSPPGDALVAIEGLDTPVGPGSTLATVAVVNEIKVRTAALLVERGIQPPVITASCLVGEERSAALFTAAYDEHARRLAGALTGSFEYFPPPDA